MKNKKTKCVGGGAGGDSADRSACEYTQPQQHLVLGTHRQKCRDTCGAWRVHSGHESLFI